MCFCITLDQAVALNINCGTRGLEVGFQGERRELRCVCGSNSGGVFLDIVPSLELM